jgi:tetratricopeptide (TPR) repeat protein
MLFRKTITGVWEGQEKEPIPSLDLWCSAFYFQTCQKESRTMKSRSSRWIVVLLGLSVTLSAAALSAGDLENGKVLLERATVGLFNESLSRSALRELLDRSLESFSRVQDRCKRDYWQARVFYLYGFVEQGAQRPEEAEKRFTTGLGLAESSLSCGQFSDGYRLLADIQAQLLMFNGMSYKMRYGPLVREYAEKALELDPDNIKAKLNLALYYKNAPAIAGGSEKTARKILHDVERAGSLEKLDAFSVYVWLGISYAEGEDASTARSYIDQALEIFPGNTWLQEIISEYSL